MRAVIFRFLQMEVVTDHAMITWALLGVWCLLLAAAWSSLRAQSAPSWVIWTWGAVILAVPIVGLSAYVFWCLFRADWGFLKPLMQSRSQAVRSVTHPKVKPGR